MIALFGSKWTSQFGESVDPSGQWGKTLAGLSRGDIAGGLEAVRHSGRAWPPTAPEFRSMCGSTGIGNLKTIDQAASEFSRFIKAGARDKSGLSPEVYHTITENCSMFTLAQLPFDKCDSAFRSAYRATLEDCRQGVDLRQPPGPETLLEQKDKPQLTPEQAEEARAKGRAAVKSLIASFGGDDE